MGHLLYCEKENLGERLQEASRGQRRESLAMKGNKVNGREIKTGEVQKGRRD